MTAVPHAPGRTGAGWQDSAPAAPEHPGGPFPRSRPRRRLSLPGLAWRQVRRAPATISCLAAVWIAGLATGSIAHGPPPWLS